MRSVLQLHLPNSRDLFRFARHAPAQLTDDVGSFEVNTFSADETTLWGGVLTQVGLNVQWRFFVVRPHRQNRLAVMKFLHDRQDRKTILNISGEITVTAPRQAVFDALSDARFFASCIEGVRDFRELDSNHYEAVLDTRIAYMRFSFTVLVEISRVSSPDEIEAKVEGTPLGMVGRLTATATTRLVEAAGGTIVHYSIDAILTGKLGSMGQSVLKAKARDMERGFAGRLSSAFADRGRAP